MESRVTYCRICEAACGLIADVEAGRVVRLRPDRDHVVSRGFVCAKGTRFLDVHTSPERVDHALMRENGQLRRASYERVIGDAGDRLARIVREHGPHAVGIYVGNPAAFSFSLPLLALGFVKAIGTRNYFTAGSLDCNNKFVVSERMLGSVAVHPVPDLDHAKFALLIGTNPSVSQSSFVNAPRMVERLQGIERRGGSVVVVDPRRTETARSVGQWLPIVPDTDALELAASVTDDMTPGAVAVPHGYGHEPASGWQSAVRRGGQNVNVLAESGTDALDPLTGMCRFVGVPIRVERVAHAADGIALELA